MLYVILYNMKTQELKYVDGSKYLTAEEAATILGIKENVLRNYLSLGRLTKYKFKTLTLIKTEEIQRCKTTKKN